MLKRTLITTSLVAFMSHSLLAEESDYGKIYQGYGQGEGRGQGYGQGEGRGQGRGYGQNHQGQSSANRAELLSSISKGNVTDRQKEGMRYMIEEEKVARDVYLALYKKWKSHVFNNIAKAEQKHMDAVGELFSKYNFEVPSSLKEEGKFENAELQKLYDDLVAKGQTSLLDALEVGVMVEETDIADLKELLEVDILDDFKLVYDNLLKGSNRHLRSFNRQISRQ